MSIDLILVATTQTGDIAALAKRAEAIGFDSLWIPEHPVIPSGPLSPFSFALSLPEHYGRRMAPVVERAKTL